MKNAKSILSLLLAIALVLSMAACGEDQPPATAPIESTAATEPTTEPATEPPTAPPCRADL